jgi:ATP-grasp domain
MFNNVLQDNFEEIRTSKKVLSHFEFWPVWLFYLPVYIYVIYLMIRYRSIMLPTAVNPELDDGKFVGESKNEILNVIAKHLPEYAVKHCLVRNQASPKAAELLSHTENLLVKEGIKYPFVAKPDQGCRGAGVNLIQSRDELESYIQSFPKNEAFICHELIPYESEIGIFYCRMPWESNGKIISLTLKFFPKLLGDGIHTVGELISLDARASQLTHIYYPRLREKLYNIPKQGDEVRLVFAGNHSKGAIFKNGSQYISATLTETFDRIAKRLPNFYFGRFDIRYKNIHSLELGQEFKIVEINGVSSESTHIWDSDYSLVNAYRELFKQFHLAFMIGDYNHKHGFKIQGFKDFYLSYLREKKLSRLYPKTH